MRRNQRRCSRRTVDYDENSSDCSSFGNNGGGGDDDAYSLDPDDENDSDDEEFEFEFEIDSIPVVDDSDGTPSDSQPRGRRIGTARSTGRSTIDF